jgi:hypothetical protein
MAEPVSLAMALAIKVLPLPVKQEGKPTNALAG